jgi:hypothetical protein
MPAIAEATRNPADAVPTPDAEVRCCSRCGRLLPVTAFRRRGRGDDRPRADCTRCAGAAQKAARHKRRRREVGRALSDVYAYRDRPSKVATIAVAISQRIGGPDALAKIVAEIVADRRLKPFGHARILLGVATLFFYAELAEDRRRAV